MINLARIALGMVLAGLVGCSGPAYQPEEVDQESYPLLAWVRPGPHLLFDRHPSECYSAQQFCHRSAWPGAERDFSGGEVVEYQEYLVDREHGFPSFHDRTYRRFSARRTGLSFR